MSETLEVREVDAARVQGLRTEILRDWEPGELCVYDEDDYEDTHHYAVLDGGGEVLAVVTYIRRAMPGRGGHAAYQLRGMAVEPIAQRQGLGTRLVDSSLPRLALAESDARLVWCNAREPAIAFYERLGFQGVGALFDVEDIGPHLRMYRDMPTVMAGS